MKMSSPVLCAVILLACAVTFSAAQSSCKGRCGGEYYRGYMCQCDYNCLSYGECCKDYESQCTTKSSCKGRCGEAFKRGRLCSCDADCMKYKQCCADHASHCDAEAEMSGAATATAPQKTSSCDNVKDNKPQEPPLSEADEQTFSEGNDADEGLAQLEDVTSYSTGDSGDDINGQVFPNDEFYDIGLEDPGTTSVPESTSGYGSTSSDLLDPQVPSEPTLEPETLELSNDTDTAFPPTEVTPSDNEPTQADSDLLDPQVPSEPTLEPDTLELSNDTDTAFPPTEVTPSDNEPTQADSGLLDPQVPSEPTLEPDTLELSNDTDTALPPTEVTPLDNEPTQADDGLTTPHMSSGEPPTESTDVTDPTSSTYEGITLPESTAAEDSASTDPTSAAPTELPPTASTPELEAPGQEDVSPDAQMTETPEASSDEPEVSVLTQDNTDVTPVPDATTANPSPDADVNNPEDATTDLPSVQTSTSAPSAEPDALTTDIPSTTAAAQEETTTQATSDKPKEVTQALSKPEPQKKPEQPKLPTPKPAPAKPIFKPEAKPLVYDTTGFQADDSNDTNLCSGRPVSGLTTLRNGTIAVFRGHYFWLLDRNRMPGPAQGITQVWGIPSPIDTVFTRCNCQGKTYIFKGPKYWRFENDVLDPGYPRVIESGFEGLRGHITAALSVPQYHRRAEAVYFFKRGGLVQKYSYQAGTSPTCGRKPQVGVYTVRHRMVRQAVSALGPTINIRTSWRGFPSTITAAVSVPNNRQPDGYKYYVFSRSKSYNVRMDGPRPVVAAPEANASPQSNQVFKCPKKV